MALKFKGVKEILFGDFELKEKETIKEFWTKLFGGYRLPVCPLCEINMDLFHCEISRIVPFAFSFGSRMPLRVPSLKPDEIILEFRCPKCGSTISGQGFGLILEPEGKWFSVEKFLVTNFKGDLKCP